MRRAERGRAARHRAAIFNQAGSILRLDVMKREARIQCVSTRQPRLWEHAAGELQSYLK
jgi:hypothetical protein